MLESSQFECLIFAIYLLKQIKVGDNNKQLVRALVTCLRN